jgi:ABC-2 type transport system ATP-binding protein
LNSYRKFRTNNLSRGNRQKLALALSLIHSPKILIMDEPLNYLDIPSQERIMELLNDMEATFLVSTHIMSIAERLTEKVVMISKGHHIWEGTIEELRERGTQSEPIESIVSRLMKSAP